MGNSAGVEGFRKMKNKTFFKMNHNKLRTKMFRGPWILLRIYMKDHLFLQILVLRHILMREININECDAYD